MNHRGLFYLHQKPNYISIVNVAYGISRLKGSQSRMEFHTPYFEMVLDYWKSLCSENRIPTVSQFDPIKVPAALPDITLWELMDNQEIRCRLAGTAVVERMNVDITGAELTDIMAPKARHLVLQDFQNMLCHRCGVWYQVVNRHPTGKVVLVNTMILPLFPEPDRVAKFVALNDQREVMGYEIDEAKIELGRGFQEREYIDTGWGVPPIQSEETA